MKITVAIWNFWGIVGGQSDIIQSIWQSRQKYHAIQNDQDLNLKSHMKKLL